MYHKRTRLTILGTGAAILESPYEPSCYVVNKDLMIDLGWCGVLKMPGLGLHPRTINTVVVTHCHSDHILGLPQLLMFRGPYSASSVDPLEIVGPVSHIEGIVEAAVKYVEAIGEGPAPSIRLVPLEPGDSHKSGQYEIETCSALHTIKGFSLRVTDLKSGAILAFSGDTTYNPQFVSLAHHADILIHEATLGATIPEDDVDGHCGGAEAALVAKQAQVGQLLLTHMPRGRRLPGLTGALAHFPSTALAEDGDVVEIVHGHQGCNQK